MRAGSSAIPSECGFTLIAVLAALFMLGLGTQGVMTWVSEEARRERETALLRVGEDYLWAIRSYYEASPGTVKQWPRTLADLTDDTRFVGVRRHLRRVHADPVGRSTDWGLVPSSDGTGISGVYSLSEDAPSRTAAVNIAGTTVGPAARYSDWKFVYQTPTLTSMR